MKRFAALDTSFLLALAGGEPDTEATIDYLFRNGFFPIITESVLEQLGELAESKDEMVKQNALRALKSLTTWQVLVSSNKYVENGAAQVHAERIMTQGLVPEATHFETEILVEASCHNCELLITFSKPLLDADSTTLNLALIEGDLNKVTVTIASPKTIARRLEMMEPANRGANVVVSVAS